MSEAGLKHNARAFFSRLRGRAEYEAAHLPDLQLRADKAAQSIFNADHNQHKTGTGEKFWQYREYTQGDRPQDIDWRQSAKGDRIYIRQKEWQTTQTALFWCQNNESMQYHGDAKSPTKAEDAITLSLALAKMLTQAGEQIALLDGRLNAGRSEKALSKLGETLCRRNNKALPNANIHDLPRNSSLFLIGDFLAPVDQLMRALKPLQGYVENAVLIQVLDPSELYLPFSGNLVFKQDDAPTTAKHRITNVQSIRTAYQQRMQDHIGAVQALCQKLQWSYCLHENGAQLTNTLSIIWGNMAKGGAMHK